MRQHPPLVSGSTLQHTRMLSGMRDYETDAVIQRSLRTELKSDVTVITIAHRLQTIMDYDMIVRSQKCSPVLV